MEKYININELDTILSKHFKKKNCMIISAEIGTVNQQHHPKEYKLGAGSQLTIKVELF